MSTTPLLLNMGPVQGQDPLIKHTRTWMTRKGFPACAVADSSALCLRFRYPGPHIQPPQLVPYLTALQTNLSSFTPKQLHQLLTAAASLGIQPSNPWLQEVALAASQQFAGSSFQQLVLMLQGLTACMPQAGGSVLDAAWWQSWFEATASRCAAVSLAASAGAAACDSKLSSGSGSGLAAAVLGFDTVSAAAAGSGSPKSQSPEQASWGSEAVIDSSFDSLSQPVQQLQQQDVVSAEVLFDALLVLLRVKQPVHPLWLAGTLEAYHW